MIINTPGAGGYGDPAGRDAASIEADRRSGKFSEDYMARHYGNRTA